jgi:CTP-dependent riboflavin kinase
VSAEEVNFHPSGESGKERLHPALLSLVLAYSRDLNALARPRRLKQLYSELGFSIGERQLRNHRQWLLEREYIVLYRSSRGWRVELTEKGLRLLRSLGLPERARA